ncbi:MAG: hypothetical protein ACRDYA_13310 [Egibacteraceae bacterium]
MNEHPGGDDRLTPPEIIGPAIIGSGQYLCWTPCHRKPIRLYASEFEPWLPVVVECRRCGEFWTVAFPSRPPGVDAIAIWRRVTPGGEGDA